MTALSVTYRQFWNQFTAPAMPPQQGRTPVPARPTIERTESLVFPRITFPIIRPGTLRQALFTVSIWDRHPVIAGFTPRVYDIQGQIEKAIPYEGVVLPVEGGGYIWLQRGTPFFPETLSEEAPSLVVQGLCNVIARDYAI